MGLSVISSPPGRNSNRTSKENIKMVQMKGKYLRTEEKDYEKFLSAVGVGFMYRKAATASTPTMTITKSGDKWTMETATTLKTMKIEFKLGEVFDDKTPDGRDVTCTVTQEGDDKLVTVQVPKDPKGKTIEVTRTFTDDGINVIYKCDGVISPQFFKRQ